MLPLVLHWASLPHRPVPETAITPFQWRFGVDFLLIFLVVWGKWNDVKWRKIVWVASILRFEACSGVDERQRTYEYRKPIVSDTQPGCPSRECRENMLWESAGKICTQFLLEQVCKSTCNILTCLFFNCPSTKETRCSTVWLMSFVICIHLRPWCMTSSPIVFRHFRRIAAPGGGLEQGYHVVERCFGMYMMFARYSFYLHI